MLRYLISWFPPTQAELDRITQALLDALEMMHAKNFLHRDIAPDNIIVRADGSPVLLDFGAARRAVAEMSRSLTGIVKAGYSPHEQYSADGRLQGPWSDIYALGGTLYRSVTGRVPEESTLRVDVDRMPSAAQIARPGYRPQFLAAIDACLRVRQTERPQTVAALRPMLLGLGGRVTPETRPTTRTRSIDAGPTAEQGHKVRPSGRWWALAATLLLVVFGGAFGGYEFTRWQQDGAVVPARQKAGEAEPQAALDSERQHREATEAAQQQAEQDAEKRRREAAAAAARAEAAQRKEEEARVAAEAERRRQEAAVIAEREAAQAVERRKREEERIAAAEVEAKNAREREALTRSLQTALKRAGCYAADVDGQWGDKGRAALTQFAKRSKLALATDEPSAAALEAVVARTRRVCPMECNEGEIESNGRCVRSVGKTAKSDRRGVDADSKRAQRSVPAEPSRPERSEERGSGTCWGMTGQVPMPCSLAPNRQRAY
jgi:hypothetical protein